jgi:tRNA(adenine34) deaminase
MITPFSDEYFMKRALAEAKAAYDEDEVPVGAVIVHGDRIIASAHNQTERLKDPTAHAEMIAITAATGSLGAKYLINCRLYVTVEPCLMCAGAIAWAQISEVIYGATDEKRGFRKFTSEAPGKTIFKGGIMEMECSMLMKNFFKNKRPA